MNWIPINTEDDVQALAAASHQQPQVIYKHSNRCGISSMVLNRLQREDPPEEAAFHFLDLIPNRGVSNYVSRHFNVHHESPQVLIIKNGVCVYNESHNGISMDEIASVVAEKN